MFHVKQINQAPDVSRETLVLGNAPFDPRNQSEGRQAQDKGDLSVLVLGQDRQREELDALLAQRLALRRAVASPWMPRAGASS